MPNNAAHFELHGVETEQPRIFRGEQTSLNSQEFPIALGVGQEGWNEGQL
jgi:hypothetical protein